jgi:8-oxo-dGTP pyrophosphatase MutT (NUDIX family)
MNKEVYLSMLMNNMTVDEKVIIMSMNFDNIWFYYHLSIPDVNYINSTQYKLYHRNKKIFNETFNNGNAMMLIDIIKTSKSISNVWEIPKGRKNKNEDGLNCAIREFEEETNIKCHRMTFLDHPPFKFTFCNMGVRYTYIYYISVLKSPITPRVKFSNKDQIVEVGQIKWLTMKDLYFINDPQLITIYKKIHKIVKNKRINKPNKKYNTTGQFNMCRHTRSEPVLHNPNRLPNRLPNKQPITLSKNSFAVLSINN